MEPSLRFRPFDTRGSDERQYCSPGFNLPVGQFARTVYSEYDGYHNSMDNKEFVQIESLVDSANVIEQVLETFEYAGYYITQNPYGEPMMSKRDLYPTLNRPDESTRRDLTKQMMRILNYSDGSHSIVKIAEQFDLSVKNLEMTIEQLEAVGLISHVPKTPSYEITYSP
jgi:aminopeptidase-like protein